MSEKAASDLTGLELLRSLSSFDGRTHTPYAEAITLIIPAGKDIRDLDRLVSGSSVDARRGRKYLREISSLLKGHDVPQNGCGIFVKRFGAAADDEVHIVEPPRPVKEFDLSDGAHFVTEPLEMLFGDDPPEFGVVRIIGEQTEFWRLRWNPHSGNHSLRQAYKTRKAQLPKRHGRGGQSALRFARLAEETRAAYVRLVAESCNAAFCNDAGELDVEAVVIAGSEELRTNLIASAHFVPVVRKAIIPAQTGTIGDHDSVGTIAQKCGELIGTHRLANERKEVQAFLEQMKKKMDLTGYGVADVRRLCRLGNVQKMLYHPRGEGPLSTLVTEVEDQGGDVIRLTQGLPEAEEILKSYGGAVALLRWPRDD